MRTLSALTLALALSLTAGAAAQTITLLGDQNPTPNLVNPASQGRPGAADTINWGSFVNSGAYSFFVAEDALGIELNVTAQMVPPVPSTTLRIDIFPGPPSSYPGGLTAYNGDVYCWADSGMGFGRELLRIGMANPAAPVPIPMGDINPGPASSSLGGDEEAGSMVVMGGLLYFLVDAPGVAGLYATNGVTITMIQPLQPMPVKATSNPPRLVYGEEAPRILTDGALLYFAADDGTGRGYELMISNGVPGAAITFDLNPGPASSLPNGFYHWVGAGAVVFRADNGVIGEELWSCVGGVPGIIADLDPGPASSYPADFCEHTPNQLLFSAQNPLTGGRELYSSNGFAAGLLRDINVGPASSDPYSFVLAGTNTYFTCEGVTGDRQVWKTNGTAAGTVQVTTLVGPPPMDGWNGVGGGPLGNMRLCAGHLYFYGMTSAQGTELWWIIPGPDTLVLTQPIHTVIGPWVPPSTYILPAPFGQPSLLFYQTDNILGYEPYIHNATGALGANLTLLLADINPPVAGATLGSNPTNVVSFAKDSYYTGFDGSGNKVMFQTNGTPAGTLPVAAVPGNPGTNTPAGTVWRPDALIAVGRYLYFFWEDNAGGSIDYELWRYQPETGGWLKLNFNNSPTPSVAGTPTPVVYAFASKIYYSVIGGLAQYDPLLPYTPLPGPNQNPTLVAPLAGVKSIQEVGGRLFLIADDGVIGYELWEFVPQTGVLTPLTNINPTGDSAGFMAADYWSTNYQLTATDMPLAKVANELLFFATDGVTPGCELYKMDLNTLAVSKVFTPTGFALNAGNQLEKGFALANGDAYFYADEGITGIELWRYMPGLAMQVIDLNIGAGDCLDGMAGLQNQFTPIPTPIEVGGTEQIVFVGTDGLMGEEPLVFDPLAMMTTALGDLQPGPIGSEPYKLRQIGSGQVYFEANDGFIGGELWRTDGTPPTTVAMGDINPATYDSIRGQFNMGEISYVPNYVLVAVDDGINGEELVAVDSKEGVAYPYALSLPAGASVSRAMPMDRGGCVAFGDAPELLSTDPVLATAWNLQIRDLSPAPLVPFGYVAIDFGHPNPVAASTILTQCPLYLNVFSPTAQLLVFPNPGGGTVLFPVAVVPNNPALVGAPLAAHAGALQANGMKFLGLMAPAAITNGIWVTVGL